MRNFNRVIAASLLMSAVTLASCGDDDNPITMPHGDSTPPSQVTDLSVIAAGDNTITIAWTAPGDDGHTGRAESYDIRWSHAVIMSNNFSLANTVADPPVPDAAGSAEQFTVSGIDTTLVTYIAMVARDKAANTSSLSNGIMWAPRQAPVFFKTIPSIRDNSMYEEDGTLSNGAIQYMRVGSLERSGHKVQRRGLIAFAVADSIPAGAVIDSVRLQMHVSGGYSGYVYRTTIHRVTADWGEGTSDQGGNGQDGAPATPGDATWLYRFFDTDMWATPGGDFVAMASGKRLFSTVGNYSWKSTTAMTTDVQGWLDTPTSNFGWILIGDETGEPGTAKRFDTRENPDVQARPALKIFYTVP